MNVKVNTNDVRKEIDDLSSNILEYQNNYQNLYNEINKIDSYWQDDAKVIFKEKRETEKKEIEEVIMLLNEFKSLYEDIYEKYNNIERK